MTELYPAARDVPRHDRYRDDRAGVGDTMGVLSRTAADTHEPTGFPNTNTDTTLTWVDGTRTMSIQPTGATFEYWIDGTLYSSTGATHQIPDTEGLWHVYFDTDGVLYSTLTFGEALLKDYCYIGTVYWNQPDGEAVVMGDERHGLQPWQSHLMWHEKIGTYVRSGFGLADFTIDQAGNNDVDAEFSCATGVLVDEDLTHTLATLAVPAALPVMFKDGASALWRKDVAIDAPIKLSGGAPYYNLDTAGTWSQAAISSNKYFLAHILATNDPRAGHQFVSVQGENEYNSKADARVGANTEVNDLYTGGLPMQEFLWIGTIIYKRKGSNAYESAAISTASGEDYVSWLGTELSPGTAPSSHPNLTNRDAANSHPADAVSADVTSFGNVLSSADTEVQAALDTIDDHAINSHSDVTTATGALVDSVVDGSRVGPSVHHHEAHICSVRNSAVSQDLDGTNVAVDWGAVLHVTKGTAATWVIGSPTRITINENGWYQISFNLNGTSATQRANINAQIRKDGTTVAGPIAGSGYIRYLSAVNLEASVACGAFTLYLTSGTYIEVVCNSVGVAGTWDTVDSACSFSVIQIMSNA